MKRNIVRGELLRIIGSGSELYATSDSDFKILKDKEGRREKLFHEKRTNDRVDRYMQALKRNIVRGELLRTFESELEIYATQYEDFKLAKEKD